MKTEERPPSDSPPTEGSVRADAEEADAMAADEPEGEDVEVGADWIDADDNRTRPPGDSARLRPRRSGQKALKTAEIDPDRDRRATVPSPIPGMLAEQMSLIVDDADRDPAAPLPQRRELTRKIGEADRARISGDDSAGYTVEVLDDGNAERRIRAARLIDRARAAVEGGDLANAVRAAEEALEEADRAPPPGIVEVIEPARPLLTRIFTLYVGPLSKVPVLDKTDDEVATLPLNESERTFVARVDGVRSLEQVLDGSRIPPADALRIAASLLRAQVIRLLS
jgi:hypothetical protein